MLVGYNTNISYKGTIYHVQTEDSGIRNPHIITLLYLKGIILSRKKTGYEDIASAPDYKEKVREIMKEQHKAMIKELIAGKHTAEQPPAETPPAAAEPVAEEMKPDSLSSPALETAADEVPQPSEPPALPAPEHKKQISKSLDDILLDYILKAEKGND